MPRILFVTDIHLLEGQQGPALFARDLDEIRNLEPRPDLMVLGGDICLWSSRAGDLYLDLLRDYPIPTLHIMGNHDTTLDVPEYDFGRDFQQRIGPLNQHRIMGGTHIVTLNTCRMAPEYYHMRDWHNVQGLAVDDDLSWLREQLASIRDPAAPLMVFVHIPILSTYPERMQATKADADVWRVINADDVIALLAPFHNCIVAQGHLHENEHLQQKGVHFVSVGAIAGAWWSREGYAECPDGAPRGYLIADVENRHIVLSYKSAGYPPDFQAWTFRQGDRRYLNIFFADGNEDVFLEKNKTRIRLRRADGLRLQDRWTSTHIWELPDWCEDDRIMVKTSLRRRQVVIRGVPCRDDQPPPETI